MRFGELLERVAGVDREMRIRFTSPHPKDFSDDVLEARASRSSSSDTCMTPRLGPPAPLGLLRHPDSLDAHARPAVVPRQRLQRRSSVRQCSMHRLVPLSVLCAKLGAHCVALLGGT